MGLNVKGIWAVLLLVFVGAAVGICGEVITAEQIEGDWLGQDKLRNTGPVSRKGGMKPMHDAVGGCDGVKNGWFGFHTGEEEGAWWQVDLGRLVTVERVVVYNRCDYPAGAADLKVLLSGDGKKFDEVYRHDGSVFLGYSDGKPLTVDAGSARTRFVRIQLAGQGSLHLDEVEVYGRGSSYNLAFGKAATQSSVSEWSMRRMPSEGFETRQVVERGLRLGESLRGLGASVEGEIAELESVARQIDDGAGDGRELYMKARRAVRRMAFANPLLDFDKLLFVKRMPGMLPHMSDQFYGWWSRPGGGIYLLEGFKSGWPRLRCLTEGWGEGNFLRPDLSYDGKKILFAYCKYYSHVAKMKKVDKEKLPEDMFYQIFEMNIDGTGVRQLTRGRYDDFDARYLPNGDIVFLSTRKGQFVQCSKAGIASTQRATLPDSYVRCGGGSIRPVPVFTLHAIDGYGGNLRPVSAFENFEWTPSVADDGRILYARWDYIDRFNGPFMSLWSTNQDGGNAQLVYGNFTVRPQCVFEARSIPNSHKLVFTASAHHSITGGSLCLLDRTFGSEQVMPVTRLTPEVPFPETEDWMDMYYANPYPLSEDYFLVGWSNRRLAPHGGSKEFIDQRNPSNAMGVYLYDAFGNLELIYRDSEISSMYPIPVRARKRPPVQPDGVDYEGVQEGRFLVQDIYEGLKGVERGSIKRLRIIGVPPKVQPHMNRPSIGVSREDPGKFVMGTVPVEKDGSAYFRVPSGVSVFFQALDEKGFAVQTMRSLTYVQANQTLSCIGCHESREAAPPVGGVPLAALRGASKITPGPVGTWPLRFDELVQPLLDKSCISCHSSESGDEKAAKFDLTAANSYNNLIKYSNDDLKNLAFEKDVSIAGQCVAINSKLLSLLTDGAGHKGVELDADGLNRLVTWMDVYVHRLGSFSDEQEQRLRQFRLQMASLLAE